MNKDILVISETSSINNLGYLEELTRFISRFDVEYTLSMLSVRGSINKIDEVLEQAERDNCKVIILLSDTAFGLPSIIVSKTDLPIIQVGKMLGENKEQFKIWGVLYSGYEVEAIQDAIINAFKILALKDDKYSQILIKIRVDFECLVDKEEENIFEYLNKSILNKRS